MPPRLYPAFGTSWPITRDAFDSVLVRYVAGAAALDEAVRNALLLIVGRLYEPHQHRPGRRADRCPWAPRPSSTPSASGACDPPWSRSVEFDQRVILRSRTVVTDAFGQNTADLAGCRHGLGAAHQLAQRRSLRRLADGRRQRGGAAHPLPCRRLDHLAPGVGRGGDYDITSATPYGRPRRTARGFLLPPGSKRWPLTPQQLHGFDDLIAKLRAPWRPPCASASCATPWRPALAWCALRGPAPRPAGVSRSPVKAPPRAPGTVRKAIRVRTSKVARQAGDVGVFVNVKPAPGAKFKTSTTRILGLKIKSRCRCGPAGVVPRPDRPVLLALPRIWHEEDAGPVRSSRAARPACRSLERVQGQGGRLAAEDQLQRQGAAMTAATDLRALLVADGALSALVGTRIRANRAEQGDTRPFVVFTRVDTPNGLGLTAPAWRPSRSSRCSGGRPASAMPSLPRSRPCLSPTIAPSAARWTATTRISISKLAHSPSTGGTEPPATCTKFHNAALPRAFFSSL